MVDCCGPLAIVSLSLTKTGDRESRDASGHKSCFHTFLFLLSSQTLGVLGQDGIMHFINIPTTKVLFHLGSHSNAINSVTFSPSGRHAVAILDDGSISVYSVQSLTDDLNKVTCI